MSGLIGPDSIAVCVARLPSFFTGHSLSRWEGAVFIGYHVAPTECPVPAAQAHDALSVFSVLMLWFVIPLTMVTLGVVSSRSLRERPVGA